MEDLVENVEEKIKCSYCTKVLKDPRLTPCLHSFCGQCLKKLVGQYPLRASFICPLCQTEVKKPNEDDNSDFFPSNFHLNRLLDVHLARTFDHREESCGNCKVISKLAAFCFGCDMFLCLECLTAHRRMVQNKNHRIINLSEFRCQEFDDLYRRPEFCGHERQDLEEVEFYCKDCDELICGLCNLSEEDVHSTVDILELVEARKTSIEKETAKVKERALFIRNGMKNLSDRMSEVDERIESAKKQLKIKVERLLKIIRDHEIEITEQLENVRQEKLKELLSQRQKFELLLLQTESAIEFTDPLLDRNFPAEILSLKENVSLRLRELGQQNVDTRPVESACVVYVPNVETMHTVKCCSFGHVAISNTDPQSSSADGEGVSKSYVGEETFFTLTTRDMNGNTCYSSIDRPSVTIAKTDGVSITNEIRDNENGIYDVVYTPKVAGQYTVRIRVGAGKEIRQSPHCLSVMPQVLVPVKSYESRLGGAGLFTQPRGIAVSSTGDMAISDTQKHCIHVVDSRGRSIIDLGGEGCGDGKLNYPGGVAFDKSEKHIVVADRDNHRIQMFSRKSGKMTKKFGSRGRDDGEFDGPSGVFVDNKGRIVVTDWNNHRVQVFSAEGKFLFMFGDAIEEKLKHPRDTVYHENTKHFVVSDTGNNVLKVFDAQGGYLRTIGKPGVKKGELYSPRGLVVDANDRIVVCDLDNHRLQFFDFNGTCLNSFGSKGKALGQFSYPMGVDTLNDGQIVISDWGNDRIQVLSVEPYSR